MKNKKSFDERLQEFVSAVEYPYTKEQATNVFINTSGFNFGNPTGAVMAAMLNRNNTIRIYASKVSGVMWSADSLHNFKAPISIWGGKLTDADMNNCYVLNEFLPLKELSYLREKPCLWIDNFKSVEEYKEYYHVA